MTTVIKPLRFIKSRIPDVKQGAHPSVVDEHLRMLAVYRGARILANRGNGLAVQRIAQSLL